MLDSHGPYSKSTRLGNGYFFWSTSSAHALLGWYASRIHIFCSSPLLSVVFSFEPLWQGAAPYLFAAFITGSNVAVHLLLGRLLFTVAIFLTNLASGLVTVYLWDHFLRPYQKDRIMTFTRS